MGNIGTVIDELNFFKSKLYNGIFGGRIGCFDEAIGALKELQQYRSIGTPEECRAARKKQKMRYPFKSPDGHMNCAICEEVVRFPLEYCQNCGQSTDWSGVDDA